MNPYRTTGITLLSVLILGGGFALSPWGRRLLNKESHKLPPVADHSIPGVSHQVLDDAYGEARHAQDAAEKLSEMLSRFQINRRLIADAQSRRQPDTEALEAYRLAEETLERQIRDAENALLQHAKQLHSYPPEVQAEAFDRLDRYVAAMGVSWRTHVAELIRRYLPATPDDAVRVDAALREGLRKVQTPP